MKADKVEFYGVSVSRDGRWLTIIAAKGNARMNDLYIADRQDGGTPRAVVEGVQAATGGEVCEDDGQLLLHTNLDAPNGRLVRTDPSTPTPEHWHGLIGESAEVLVAALPTTTPSSPSTPGQQPAASASTTAHPEPLGPRSPSRTGDSGRHIHDLGPHDP